MADKYEKAIARLSGLKGWEFAPAGRCLWCTPPINEPRYRRTYGYGIYIMLKSIREERDPSTYVREQHARRFRT